MAFSGGGYNLHFGKLVFGPALALQGNYVSIDSFKEHGSLSPLRIPTQSESSLRSACGFQSIHSLPSGRGSLGDSAGVRFLAA